MTDAEKVPIQDRIADRKELYEQVAAILRAQGLAVDEQVKMYLQPLLDGTLDYAQHRAALEAMLAEPDA